MEDNVISSISDPEMKPEDLAEQIIKAFVDGEEPLDDRCVFLRLQIVEARLIFVSCGDSGTSREDTDNIGDDDALQLILAALESGFNPARDSQEA